MSTATDKAIPTWGEVKNIALQKKYHWAWYRQINSVSKTSYTADGIKALSENVGTSHSPIESTLFQLSLGEIWTSTSFGDAATNIYPIYSCVLPPCHNVHGIINIPDCTLKYGTASLMLSNIKLRLSDFTFKTLTFNLCADNEYTLNDVRLFWEVQQLTTV